MCIAIGTRKGLRTARLVDDEVYWRMAGDTTKLVPESA